MILFPAIDLKDGKCVRLKKGDMERATIYDDNPGSRAAHFEGLGFEYIHIVDLNGAFAGKLVNLDAIDDILSSISIPAQLGGGIRDLKTIEKCLRKGVSRVILGTIATKNPDIVIQACNEFPGQIVIGIDARGSNVAVEGWAEESNIDIIDLAQEFSNCGAAAIIYTDINRDGILTGLNIDSTLHLAKNTDLPVIASGGLSSIDDIKRLNQADCLILEGAITGRALYDGRLDAKEALAMQRSKA